MIRRSLAIGLLTLTPLAAIPAQKAAPPERITFSYADLADLALPAQVAAQVRVKEAIPLGKDQAAGVPAGRTRYYVEADVTSLIRGPIGLPARLSYLTDLPNAADSSTKLKNKAEYLVLANPVAGRAGELKLVDKDAHIPWTAELGQRIRSLLKEAVAPNAAPQIVGVGNVFHVAGTLPGESESQLFLQAADGRPVSISVLRRPNQAPSWAVALGEIVDEAAGPPAPDSLLWYRLACTLPRQLPDQSLADVDAENANALRADYALVMEKLGSCARNRKRS